MNLEYYKKYEPLFGKWHIVREIGRGSYGSVYEIEQEEFGINYTAAMKAITIPKDENERMQVIYSQGNDELSAATFFRSVVEDFNNECRIMSKLKGNSTIVSYEDHQIIKHEDDLGWDILVKMELLTPLLKYLDGKEVDETLVRTIGIDICSALELCGRYNIIHRDIKPDNIFVSDIGNFKLGDFGVARIVESTSGASTRVGTRDYAAPEVIKEYAGYDNRVDIYSLGILLYRMLNGNRIPFVSPEDTPISIKVLDEARKKRLMGIQLPAPYYATSAMSSIILKACQYNPDDRFQSPAEMKYELERLIHSADERRFIYDEPDYDGEKTNEEELPEYESLTEDLSDAQITTDIITEEETDYESESEFETNDEYLESDDLYEAESENGSKIKTVSDHEDSFPEPVILNPVPFEDYDLIFKNVIGIRHMRERLYRTIPMCSMYSKNGNVIVYGGNKAERRKLEKDIIRYMKAAYDDLVGAFGLRKKEIEQLVANKSLDSVIPDYESVILLLDDAGTVAISSVESLIRSIKRSGIHILVIADIADQKMLNEFIKKPVIADFFNVTIELPAVNIDELMKYAINYAQKREYTIDYAGKLMLRKLIRERGRGNHRVTEEEIESIMETAIEISERMSLGLVKDIMLGRRYDGEDRIILSDRCFNSELLFGTYYDSGRLDINKLGEDI